MNDALIVRLAIARREKQNVKDAMNMMLASITSSTDYKELEASLNDAILVEAEELQAVKDAALNEFVKTGEKHPHPTIVVKEYIDITITDPIGAVEWCLTHLTADLALDEKAFKDDAKKGKVPERFIDERTDVRVTISQDLSKYIFDVT